MQALTNKLPSELKAEALKPFYNRLILLLGTVILLISTVALLGHWVDLPWLYTLETQPDETSMPVPTAISLFSLGIAIPAILDNRPYEERPRWLWAVRYLSLLVPACTGFYWLFAYLASPQFGFLDLSTHGLKEVSFITATFLLLTTFALGNFLARQHFENMIVYLVDIPGLLIFNIGLLALVGHLFETPLLYGYRMALPTSIVALLTGIIILIGTLPFRGLLIPLLSHLPKARLMAYSSFVIGLSVLFLGWSGIALVLKYGDFGDKILNLELRQLCTAAILLTSAVAIGMKVIGLRATRYFSEATYYAQQQQEVARQEAVTRQIVQIVHSGLDLEEIFQKMANSLGVFLAADRCFISRYDSKAKLLNPPTREYRSSSAIKTMLDADLDEWRVASNCADYLCNEKEPIPFAPQVPNLSTETKTYLEKLQVQSGLACAISYRGNCMAVLFIHQVNRARTWTDIEKAVINIVANQSAIAISQAELYNQKAETEARKTAMLESSLDAIITIDQHSNIVEWNAAAERIFGYPRTEAIGKNMAELIIPEQYRKAHFRGIAHYLATGEGPCIGRVIEVEALRADGTEFISELAIARTPIEGAPLFTGTMRDITERKRAEATIWDSQQQLAESNRDLEQFAIIASHDLQAPLRKIQIFSDQVLANEAGNLKPESRDLLARINRSVMTAQTLVHDLLALSKVTKTGQPFQRLPLAQVLNRALSNLEVQIHEKHARVELGNLVTLRGDARQLEQLFQNLIENSLKYQPPEQIPVIKIHSNCDNNQTCEIVVEDNGIGFDDKQAEQIFQPFERLHGKASPYSGTGVGLAICRRIVERHGGTITASGKPGQGATFTIRLPIIAAELRPAISTAFSVN